MHEHSFVPAAGHDWLLPLYDPLLRLLRVSSIHEGLIQAAAPGPGTRVLDVGCGTGSLAVRLAEGHPEAHVTGVDPDERALARARRKAERAGASVHFERGLAAELPCADGSFERVLTSFMLHHLQSGQKPAALREMRRVLAPGGTLHLVDFVSNGRPGWIARLLHGPEEMGQSIRQLEELIREAGFADVQELEQRQSLVGNVCHLRAH